MAQWLASALALQAVGKCLLTTSPARSKPKRSNKVHLL